MLKSIFKHAIVLPLVLGSAAAMATTYNFTQITSNGEAPVASQLLVDVTQAGANVLFTFTNTSVISSSITDIYFDYGNTNYFSSVSNDILGAAGDSAGVSFADGANPGNLPAGNTVSFSADASGDSNSGPPGVPANGVNASTEFVSFLGTTLNGITFADVLAGIDSGAFRLGLHIQSIDGEGSESFVNTPSEVPLPAAGWLFGSALVGLMGLRRRKL